MAIKLDLSNSLKFKSNATVRLHWSSQTCDLLLVVDSNICPTSTPSSDIRV